MPFILPPNFAILQNQLRTVTFTPLPLLHVRPDNTRSWLACTLQVHSAPHICATVAPAAMVLRRTTGHRCTPVWRTVLCRPPRRLFKQGRT